MRVEHLSLDIVNSTSGSRQGSGEIMAETEGLRLHRSSEELGSWYVGVVASACVVRAQIETPFIGVFVLGSIRHA